MHELLFCHHAGAQARVDKHTWSLASPLLFLWVPLPHCSPLATSLPARSRCCMSLPLCLRVGWEHCQYIPSQADGEKWRKIIYILFFVIQDGLIFFPPSFPSLKVWELVLNLLTSAERMCVWKKLPPSLPPLSSPPLPCWWVGRGLCFGSGLCILVETHK